MATVHILTQYIWPDAAPTGLYAEQLALRLQQEGWDARLVGGQGNYRKLRRSKPGVPIFHLKHYHGRRGSLVQTFLEYASVKRAFAAYIEKFVRRGDVVVVTSAPPNTVQLAPHIKRHGAKAVYWLQDYYPELIRGIYEYPAPFRRAFSRYWDHLLGQWNRVVKIGSNLAGPSENSVVIRNWPTFTFDRPTLFQPRTALYSGNLGYGHDVGLLITACEQLRDLGYTLTVRADGRGTARLPSWLQVQPLHDDPELLKQDLLRNEVHLIAAHPRICRAIFPSKIWNSIAADRRLICTGFSAEMAMELEAAQKAPFQSHLDQWTQLLSQLAEDKRPRVPTHFSALSPAPTPLEPVAIA